MQAETTSSSLLSRVGDGDEAAWREFDARYGNLIIRYCCRLGLQHTDAEDIRQVVMARLTRALPSFHYQRTRGRFRTYLGHVVRNEVARRFARPGSHLPSVDLDERSQAEAAGSEPLDADWEKEWIQHHLRLAMRRVRQSHDPRSVKVFERLLAGETPAEVAVALGMNLEAVHKVKQRIRDRLREIVAEQIRDEG